MSDSMHNPPKDDDESSAADQSNENSEEKSTPDPNEDEPFGDNPQELQGDDPASGGS